MNTSKDHYKLLVFDFIRQRELEADPKVSQQIEYVGQLARPDNAIVASGSLFV